MGVGGAHNGGFEEAVVAMDGGHDVDDKRDELEVFFRGLAGSEEEFSAVGAEAPVVVLAGAVYAGKGFFVEENTEVVAACNFGHERHEEEVVVVGEVCLLENGRELKLVGGNFVVARLCGDAEAVAFDFEVEHESFDTRGNCAEVMVFELLVFGAFVAHECTPGHDEVGTGAV